MIDKETYNKIQEILKENTEETASKIGIILTEVAIYMIEHYNITSEQLLNSLKNCIEIVEKEKEQNEE